MELSNGVLIHFPSDAGRGADLAVRLTKPQLLGLMTGVTDGVETTGDASVLQRLLSLTDNPEPDFAIVTP